MIAYITSLPEPLFIAFLIAIGVFSLFLGLKIAATQSALKHKRQNKTSETEHQQLHRGMKRLWEEDKARLDEENKDLKVRLEAFEARLEDYRKKISGLGLMSFSGSKKRADILYSLLLENEALEQLLNSQSQKMVDQTQSHLNEKLMDIRKRQRLLAEIFNDDTIKNYVRETLSETAPAIETNENGNAQLAEKESTKAIQE